MLESIAKAYQIPDFVIINLVSFSLSMLKWNFCILLLSKNYHRRGHFALRFPGMLFGGLLLAWLLSFCTPSAGTSTVAVHLLRIGTHSITNFYIFFVILACYKERLSELLLCWCMTLSVNNFTSDSYALLQNLLGIDDKATFSLVPLASRESNLVLFALYHVGFFVLFAILFAKRYKLWQNRRSSIAVVSISIGLVLLNNVFGNISRVYEDMEAAPELTILNKVFFLTCTVFVILLATEVLRQNKLSQDLLVTEQLLFQEKHQYEMTKESVETINMKCHDLKRRLSSLEGRLDEQELSDLKQAIEIYDSNIKTGNPILDVVLYEKQLLCERHHIRLGHAGDGTLLSFLTPSHLYSLLGNALDNAIEAAKRLEDGEKRLIDLSVSARGEEVAIEVVNYFSGQLHVVEGTPRTTKPDVGRHGYGIMSMRYVAEQYHGTLDVETVNDIFILHVVLHKPKGEGMVFHAASILSRVHE